MKEKDLQKQHLYQKMRFHGAYLEKHEDKQQALSQEQKAKAPAQEGQSSVGFGGWLQATGDLAKSVTLTLSENIQKALKKAENSVQLPRKIIAGKGLIGGGDLSEDVTLALSPEILEKDKIIAKVESHQKEMEALARAFDMNFQWQQERTDNLAQAFVRWEEDHEQGPKVHSIDYYIYIAEGERNRPAVADGENGIVLHAHVFDEDNQPIEGVEVEWSSNYPDDIIFQWFYPSDKDGIAMVQVQSHKILENVILRAKCKTQKNWVRAEPEFEFIKMDSSSLAFTLLDDVVRKPISFDNDERYYEKSFTYGVQAKDHKGREVSNVLRMLALLTDRIEEDGIVILDESGPVNRRGITVHSTKPIKEYRFGARWNEGVCTDDSRPYVYADKVVEFYDPNKQDKQ